MNSDLFGDEVPNKPDKPSRQKARPEKQPRKKKTDAPEPKANKFAGKSSNKAEISVSPQPVHEPVDSSSNKAGISASLQQPREEKMTPSKNTRISANPTLDNSAGNLIRAVDTFRMFGMIDE